jgi:hypothetical protein
MPTFQDPTADATEAQQALDGLAHATRTINDPREIYAVLTQPEPLEGHRWTLIWTPSRLHSMGRPTIC